MLSVASGEEEEGRKRSNTDVRLRAEGLRYVGRRRRGGGRRREEGRRHVARKEEAATRGESGSTDAGAGDGADAEGGCGATREEG